MITASIQGGRCKAAENVPSPGPPDRNGGRARCLSRPLPSTGPAAHRQRQDASVVLFHVAVLTVHVANHHVVDSIRPLPIPDPKPIPIPLPLALPSLSPETSSARAGAAAAPSPSPPLVASRRARRPSRPYQRGPPNLIHPPIADT
jgi:hypothetical protein